MIATGTAPPNRWRRLFALVAVLALSLGVTAALSVSVEAKKKKSGKKAKVFSQQVSPNAAIPEAPPTGASTAVTSTINVGKKFKGKVVGDLNVTGVQTTG